MSIFATMFTLDGDDQPPPIIYQGSHVNPSADDPRGGELLVCGIPDHCHPDARFNEDDDHGRPVPFLRLFAVEDPATYQGRVRGQATLVLDLGQVIELRDVLSSWIASRGDAQEREDGSHVSD